LGPASIVVAVLGLEQAYGFAEGFAEGKFCQSAKRDDSENRKIGMGGWKVAVAIGKVDTDG
jgi:hypothetical protein